MNHLQMPGVRQQLSARGMAIRLDRGNYTVYHHDNRHGDEATFDNLEDAYYGGLTMAAKRNLNSQKGVR